VPLRCRLFFYLLRIDMSGPILLLTGRRGVGKTTVCRQVVARAQAAGYACGGVLTVAGDEPGQRSVVDLRTGDTRPLTTPAGGVRQGRYRFDPRVLSWASEALARALPCDLLVVDELGPLEIEREQGWAGALDRLHEGRFRLAIVVVRPELLARVQALLGSLSPSTLTVRPRNRDRLPSVLLAMLERVA
jgi:nucleoside-triphosphatase